MVLMKNCDSDGVEPWGPDVTVRLKYEWTILGGHERSRDES